MDELRTMRSIEERTILNLRKGVRTACSRMMSDLPTKMGHDKV